MSGHHSTSMRSVARPPVPAASLRLQRKCACQAKGESCARCGGGRHAVDQVLRMSGAPLDADVLGFMQPRFGHDLSGVRIHTGALAERAAQTLEARAFTVGRDVVFGAGRYQPRIEHGQRLLAHELAHTVQQRGAAPQPRLATSRPGDRAEREASSAARQVMAGGLQTPLSPTAAMLQRAPGDEDTGGVGRSSGLTRTEWDKIRQTRTFYQLPPRPTSGNRTIVGVLIGPNGEEVRLKSGAGEDTHGGPSRGGIPRGRGEVFSGGGPSEKNIVTHVEGKAAAVMHQRKWISATLLIEEVPCAVCDKPTGAPGVSGAIPPGAKLRVVDPGASTLYSSYRAPPLGAPGTAPKAGGLPQLPQTPKAGLTPKAGPAAAEASALRRTAGGRIAPQALRGLGNFALTVGLLAATIVFELTVAPKLRALQAKLGKMIAELEEQRRQRLMQQIQKRFDAYQSKRIGRIVKSCYLPMLRRLEAQGKTAYVNVELKVIFEDTSGRFQLFEETPPESLFDLEFNDVELSRVWIGDKGVEGNAGTLARCDTCGAMGRDKSFIGNNPLWQQIASFSFEAPKSDDIAKEFEQEPDAGDCVANLACFIATACYGTPLAPEVEVLRAFRDRVLMGSRAGRLLVRCYYAGSPPVAAWLVHDERARRLVREHAVAPLVRQLRRRGYGEPQEPLR
jgi:hypothetical protein